MATLSKALQLNKHVRSLSMGGNKIGDAGATELAVALRYNTNITGIWLGNNVIGDEGVTELAKVD